MATTNLSVLLPVRDGAASLAAALESLRNQSLQGFECLVIDDGSTDSTGALLDAWKTRWSSLSVIRTSGIGIAQALNVGLDLCGSRWIARMDCDDLAHPHRLELQLALAESENLALVGCEVSHWVTGASSSMPAAGMRRHVEWVNSKHSHEELAMALWVDSPLPHPSWLVDRQAFETVGGYDENDETPEDYEWLHRFFWHAPRTGHRAGKVRGQKLLQWADAPERLTRTAKAYSEDAFNRVKAKALARRLEPEHKIFVFGLGPKSKALIPFLKDALEGRAQRLHAIVDASERKAGLVYLGVDVWSIEQWRSYTSSTERSPKTLVLNCVGTAEARNGCEGLCLESGLEPGTGFLSL